MSKSRQKAPPSTDTRCYNCRESGHVQKGCPRPAMTLCYNCHVEGHRSYECESGKRCHQCNMPDHLAKHCNAITNLCDVPSDGASSNRASRTVSRKAKKSIEDRGIQKEEVQQVASTCAASEVELDEKILPVPRGKTEDPLLEMEFEGRRNRTRKIAATSVEHPAPIGLDGVHDLSPLSQVDLGMVGDTTRGVPPGEKEATSFGEATGLLEAAGMMEGKPCSCFMGNTCDAIRQAATLLLLAKTFEGTPFVGAETLQHSGANSFAPDLAAVEAASQRPNGEAFPSARSQPPLRVDTGATITNHIGFQFESAYKMQSRNAPSGMSGGGSFRNPAHESLSDNYQFDSQSYPSRFLVPSAYRGLNMMDLRDEFIPAATYSARCCNCYEKGHMRMDCPWL